MNEMLQNILQSAVNVEAAKMAKASRTYIGNMLLEIGRDVNSMHSNTVT